MLNIMRNNYFLLLCFVVTNLFSQRFVEEVNSIAESEMKSASRLMNLQVNANTSNYDLTYSKLEFTVNPNIYNIAGKVTHTFTAKSTMSSITFDLTNELTVSSVKRGTTALSFTQNTNDELVINLGTTLTTGATSTVEINYAGAPATGEQAFTKSTHNGAPIIWTLSEPFGARDWWPCKQDLNDKIESIDVYITAPAQYVSVSNGVQVGSPITSGSNKITRFTHNYPIPAYLIAIAVTNYSVFTQSAGTVPNDFPIVNYVYPENLSSAQSSLAVTPAIMDLFETLFEVYPFHNEKYGHAQCGFGGGMEHTTVSFMGGFSRGLIAHELAHQWFGNKITCGSWEDIWLNEGFATYLALLVIEDFDGASEFVNAKQSVVNNITSLPTGNVYLSSSQAQNVNRIFSSRLSYNKGAMVLEMLRFKMGDAGFFQAIRNYLADTNLAYKYAVTSDLQSHLEAVYGSSLQEFFNDWVYNQGYPIYTISGQNWGIGQARFVINQSQSDPSVSFFEMPVPIRIYGANGEQEDIVLENTSNNQELIVNVPFAITGFEFDPEVHLVTLNSTTTLSNALFSIEKSVSLHPNPTKKTIQIVLPNDVVLLSVDVFNPIGQKVESLISNTINLENYASGVYMLTLNTNSGIIHKKIIKE
jgi:aminopeptidase N